MFLTIVKFRLSRRKTKLKITGTYKDSIFIPTDSTVIFKRM